MWEHVLGLSWWILPLMVTLSLASWMVESKKWQVLVRDLYDLSFRESVTQNLTAQAASYITPLRSGEFIAKALYFPAAQRKSITQRVFAGNYCQMMITLTLGFTALFFHEIFDLHLNYLYGTGIATVMLSIFIAYLWLSKKLNMGALSSNLWFSTLFWSLLRYLIFASNWLIILYSLGTKNVLTMTLINVAVFYLAVSIIPMIQLFDMPFRWGIVSIIFAGATYSFDTIILATTIVWLTNSVFPTLIGCALLPFQPIKLKPA